MWITYVRLRDVGGTELGPRTECGTEGGGGMLKNQERLDWTRKGGERPQVTG